jgi:hypothetical protein
MCREGFQTGFLAGVIREACLRVQEHLETAVEFLLLPRQRGLSRVDPWLRPRPAKTDHFLAGVNSQKVYVLASDPTLRNRGRKAA